MGHLVVESEATEPTIGEVKFDLLAQLALEADAVKPTMSIRNRRQGLDRRNERRRSVPGPRLSSLRGDNFSED
jgi:hypothetical protein